jgi:hypothetical protein
VLVLGQEEGLGTGTGMRHLLSSGLASEGGLAYHS